LVAQAGNHIKFPTTDNELARTKIQFATLAAFPNVIGAVDGTHVFFRPPSGPDEPLYVCRKGGHSMNAQVTCDKEMRITSVVAKYPGSTHDSFIWKNCDLREHFVSNPPNGWLLGQHKLFEKITNKGSEGPQLQLNLYLGDSGYGVEPWLITPLSEPITVKEKNFNRSLKKTRYIVENTIGLWKSVFRCIDKSGGVLLYSPLKVCKFIIATAVLHNMRRKLKLPEDEAFADVEGEEEEETPPDMDDNAITTAGNRVRKSIIETHF